MFVPFALALLTSYISYFASLLMAKREEPLYGTWHGSIVAWQHDRENREYKEQGFQEQADHNTGGEYILLCTLFIIAFIALLVAKLY